MRELAEIFRQHGSAYREKFKGRIPVSHLKTMAAIEQCRTEALAACRREGLPSELDLQ